MIIKKFQAKTEKDAVEAAQKELGQGVVILNVKSVKKKGIFSFVKSPVIEVTVAIEEENERNARNERSVILSAEPLPAPRQMTALEQLAKAKENVKTEEKEHAKPDESSSNALEERLESIESYLKQKLEADDEEKTEEENGKEQEESEQIKFMKLLYSVMIDNEVREKYANQIIDEAEKNNSPNMPLDYCLTNIYQKMILKFGQSKGIEPAKEGPKVVFFVGPTGVGKTTTIAKIASKICVERKQKVALLTADTYRIAAAEQLRTYANILEVPFRIIYSGQEIEQAYQEFSEYDYILVDTAGHSHHNIEQKDNISLMIHAMDGKAETEVYLVLSATTKYRDLKSIADTYAEIAQYKIIFTKLDETSSLGNLLNLRLHTGADLSYVTCGQNVPDDIEQFNPQTTVKQILGGKV